MIDVELPLVEHEVDRVVADEAPPRLPGQELLLQLRPLLGVESREVQRLCHGEPRSKRVRCEPSFKPADGVRL